MLVALIGIGLTVAAVVHTTAMRQDRERELLAIGRQFQTALGRYYEIQLPGGRHEYPPTLDELLHDRRVPGVRRHLRKVFVDPVTGVAEWGLVLVGGRIVGVHSLSEGRPLKQDGFAPDQGNLRGKQKYAEWLFVYPPDGVLQHDALEGNRAEALGALSSPGSVSAIATCQASESYLGGGTVLTSSRPVFTS